MSILKLLGTALILVAVGTLSACDQDDGSAEKAGERLDSAVDKTTESIENAKDEMKESVKDANDKIKDATN
ncbi:MAG: hypothetical protein ACI9W6_001144 [Motiliproteus sp.]|jgi:hypothetical protein